MKTNLASVSSLSFIMAYLFIIHYIGPYSFPFGTHKTSLGLIWCECPLIVTRRSDGSPSKQTRIRQLSPQFSVVFVRFRGTTSSQKQTDFLPLKMPLHECQESLHREIEVIIVGCVQSVDIHFDTC